MEDLLVLYFDGASRGNPGESSYGVVLYNKEGKEIKCDKGTLGRSTNNVAEYCAMLYGIDMALNIGCETLVVRGDSKLVIQQVQGTWRVRDQKLKLLHDKICSLIPKFENVIFEHVRRELNVRADELANEALDQPLLSEE